VARLCDRVLTCVTGLAERGGGSGSDSCCNGSSVSDVEALLFRYEVTERTVVRLYEERHFSAAASPSCEPKRDADAAPEKDRLRFAFCVNQLHDKEGMEDTFLDFATPLNIARMSWKQHIDLTKHEYKRKKDIGPFNFDPNRMTEWKMNVESLDHAHDINTLLALKGAVKLKSTALCSHKGEFDTIIDLQKCVYANIFLLLCI
jgi:hypothetical protein